MLFGSFRDLPTVRRPELLRPFVLLLTTLTATGTAFSQTVAPRQEPAGPVVTFEQVEPILKQHCWRCHGADHQSGGLRLDTRDFAVAGGGSGRDTLALPLENNELLRRVKSDQEGVRMPIEGPPLSAAEIELLERWINAGAPWKAPPLPEPYEVAEKSLLNRVLDHWSEYDGQQYAPAGYVLLGLLLGMLVIEQLKKRHAAGTLTAETRSGRLATRLASLSRANYLVAALIVVVGIAGQFSWNLHKKIDEQRQEIARLTATPPDAESPSGPTRAIIRAKHPPRLGGTYYRGNDERSTKLYNGGYYRTATFDLSLRSDTGERLEPGHAVTPDMSIRLEMTRAPHTSPALFTAELMKGVFVCAVPPDRLPASPGTLVSRLQTIEPDQKWVVDFPLEANPSDQRWSGQLFVYSGYSETAQGQISGSQQYLIGYNIKAEDGRLADDCDLWLGSLNNGLRIHWPDEGAILPNEWFDFRPIPEIVGGNTSDPKLIGVEEHVAEGAASPPK